MSMRTTHVPALPAPRDADSEVLVDLRDRADAVEAKIEKLSRMLRMNGARLERLETVVNLNAPTSASRDA
jgi:hypothetical protein